MEMCGQRPLKTGDSEHLKIPVLLSFRWLLAVS